MRRPAALALASFLLLAGCGGGSDPIAEPGTGAVPGLASTTTTTEAPPTVQLEEIADRSFRATADDVEGYDLVAGTDLRFDVTGRFLTAEAGCTSMTAPFDLVDGRLSWTLAPAITPAECLPERQLQDRWLLDQLSAGFDVEVVDDGLVLSNDQLTLRLDEVGGAPVDEGPSLLGTTWTLVTSVSDGEATAVAAELTPPVLQLDGDGVAQLFGGCNEGSASLSVEAGGDVLRFSDVTLTDATCSPAAADLEAQVVAVLDGATFAQVVGDTLTVTKGTSALIFQPA